jgi:nitrogen fixation NifU-like protein
VIADGLQELYHGVILDHARHPRNFRAIDGARKGTASNRMCGDRFEVYLRLTNETIADVGFQGTGCAISMASASLMTELAKGATIADARKLFDRLQQMLATPPGQRIDDDLGALTALSGVRQFPVRIRCATLAWEALRDALPAQLTSR